MSKIRIRSEQNMFKKYDIDSYSIISLYVNDPRSEISGPKILIPKVCISTKIYCSIPVKEYGGNINNSVPNCDITEVEDLSNKKTEPCCTNKIKENSEVNYIGLYDNNVKYTEDDIKKRIDFRNLNYQTALAVFGLSVVYSPTLSMYSGMLIENNINMNSVWVDDLYINKINIDNIIPNIIRDIDCFYNIPIVNPNTITVNPLSNNDLNNFYFKPNILNEKLIKNLFYYGIISPKNIYKYISIITDKVFGIPINENPDFWIKENYIPDKNIFKNAIPLPNAVFIFNSNFYKYANYFDEGKKDNIEYKNWLNSKCNAYSRSLNENIFNIESNNKRTLLEELLLFFNILKKANEFGTNNKYISSYEPTWDYTFKCNTIKKNIINLKKGENILGKDKTIDYVKECARGCNLKNININYKNQNQKLEYECENENESTNISKTNCKLLIENLFTTWQLYNREDWPKTPSKELAAFYNLLLKNNNLDLKLIINWASQVKDDLDKEYKYRKQGLKYYSKYNPFELNEMFKVLQQYTARVTWPNGLGISYNGNNEKTITKNKTNNDNNKPEYDQYIEYNQFTDLEKEFQNYKINTNNETNNETNNVTNNVTNNETNYETNNVTNNETNNETNYETNNVTNYETNYEINNLENFTNIKFDEEEIIKAFNNLKEYFDKQKLLICLIGIDETLMKDSNFSKIISSVTDTDGNVKHYSKDKNVINNHYNELSEEQNINVDLINSLEIELKVNDKKMKHVVGSLTPKEADFLKSIGYGVVINIGNSQEVIAYGNTDQDQDQYIIDKDENDSIFNLVDKEKTDKKDNDIILLPYCEANEWTFYPYPTESAKIYFPSCDDGYLELYIITPTLESANKEPIYGGGFYYKAQDKEEILYVVHDENDGSNKSNNDLIDTLLGLKRMGTLNNNSNEMDTFTQDVIVMKGEPNMFEKFNDYISYNISNWESPKLNKNKININNGYIYYKYR